MITIPDIFALAVIVGICVLIAGPREKKRPSKYIPDEIVYRFGELLVEMNAVKKIDDLAKLDNDITVFEGMYKGRADVADMVKYLIQRGNVKYQELVRRQQAMEMLN